MNEFGNRKGPANEIHKITSRTSGVCNKNKWYVPFKVWGGKLNLKLVNKVLGFYNNLCISMVS